MTCTMLRLATTGSTSTTTLTSSDLPGFALRRSLQQHTLDSDGFGSNRQCHSSGSQQLAAHTWMPDLLLLACAGAPRVGKCMQITPS